jgi:hypothetical protein
LKPIDVFHIMDMAWVARKNGDNFNPLFSGAPGLGKSEIIQLWCKTVRPLINKPVVPFIDLRGAYLESPDLVGYPSIVLKNGRQITTHNIPDFWPDGTENEHGVLFIDEINRSTSAVLNCFMQLLTDRKVHNYSLPAGWLITSAINPEGPENDVNTMDSALRDRFVMYDVNYDKVSFVEFTKENNWHSDVVSFVETGTFKYQRPEDIGDINGAKYVSPRTLSYLNSALKVGFPNDEIEMDTYTAILGRNTAMTFYSFRKNETPVTYQDVLSDWRGSKKRLEKFSDPENYKMAQISITVRDIAENYDAKECKVERLIQVHMTIPADQAYRLISELDYKLKKEGKFVDELIKEEPKLKAYLKENLKAA